MNFENIKLEKSMYQALNKSFLQILSKLDPDEQYCGTEFEDLDAFERQLKRFDIKVCGENSDKVEKFFTNYQTVLLFPEFMSRSIAKSMKEADISNNILAVKTFIKNLDYRPIILNSDKNSTNAIAEATELPELEIRTQKTLINLEKHGKLINASYETLRFQNLEVFNVILKKIGYDMAFEELTLAISSLSDSADSINVTGNGGMNYQNLLKIWEELSPYKLTTIIGNSTSISKILSINEIKDSFLNSSFKNTGNLITPLGAKIIRCDTVEDGVIIGLDKSFALQCIRYGDVSVEFDKIINKQIDNAAITSTFGFNILFKDAIKKLVF